MSKSQKIFFIVNTPFQYKVVRILITTYFENTSVIIITTFKNETHIDKHNIANMNIRRNIFSIIDLIKVKRTIKKSIKTSKNETVFFVPHLNNLLGSYCFNLVLKNTKLKINCYYEGIALFYDPKVNISSKHINVRRLTSLLSGSRYKHYSKLFPTELRTISTAYTPLSLFTSGFKNTIEFKFLDTLNENKKTFEDLILCGPLNTSSSLRMHIENLNQYFENYQNIKTTYFIKPHFETNDNIFKQMLAKYQKAGIEFHVLNKNICIEQILEQQQFKNITSVFPSSALINIKLIYKEQVNLIVITNQPKIEKVTNIFNELGILFFLEPLHRKCFI